MARSARIVRALRGGQITIPVEFRERLGITPDTPLEVAIEGDGLRIRPLAGARTARGSPWLRELYDFFAPVRDEAAAYSDEEINAAIDRAVKASRAKRV